jgi:hypothetical protein
MSKYFIFEIVSFSAIKSIKIQFQTKFNFYFEDLNASVDYIIEIFS